MHTLFINSWPDFIAGAIAALLVVFGIAVIWSIFYLSKKNSEKEKETGKDFEGEECGRVIIMCYPEINVTEVIEVR